MFEYQKVALDELYQIVLVMQSDKTFTYEAMPMHLNFVHRNLIQTKTKLAVIPGN